MTERELIVAWLRTHSTPVAKAFANSIERGEHVEEMRELTNPGEREGRS